MSAIVVRKVESKAEHKLFFEYPWKLYKDYPHWIADLPSLRRDTLNKEKHAAWEYLEGDYFLALRGEEVVGEIAAFVNHRHNKIQEENIGFFGFFECIDDQAVADALLKTAEDYLRAKGVTAVRGPANFSSNETYGLLVDSFDKDPMILMPYNPEYYIRLLENAGYDKAMDLYSWRNNFQDAQTNLYDETGKERRVVAAARRAMKRSDITTRSINMRDKHKEFTLLRQLYAQAWEKNWGFVPLTDRELDDLVSNLGFLLMPEYTFFAYVKGEPAGFMLLIPNFNDVMQPIKPHPGLPEPWWLIQALWHWKIRPKIKSLRVILMGVKEGFRGIGVDAALCLTLAEQMIHDKRGLEWAEASWVLETNDVLNSVMQHFGSHMHRTHRLYQKELHPDGG